MCLSLQTFPFLVKLAARHSIGSIGNFFCIYRGSGFVVIERIGRRTIDRLRLQFSILIEPLITFDEYSRLTNLIYRSNWKEINRFVGTRSSLEINKIFNSRETDGKTNVETGSMISQEIENRARLRPRRNHGENTVV